MKKLGGGGALVFLALFMAMGFLRSAASLGSLSTIFALLITVVLPGAGGAALLASHFRSGGRIEQRRDLLRQQTLEAEILRVAALRDGRLTVVEIVTEMAVPAELVQQALDALMLREIADVAVADSGMLVYTFRDVRDLKLKAGAKDALE